MTTVKFNRKPLTGSWNSLVDDLFADLPTIFKNDFNISDQKFSVPVNVQESDKSYRLEVVAPGFDKADFRINLEQNLLTISAEKNEDVKSENEKQIRKEYHYRTFKRSFTIDEKIDATAIDASYINGVLTLNLPKKEEVKASVKAIEIK